MYQIWFEKYRPKNIDEVIGLNDSIKQYVSNKEIPHLLFEGSAGIGKTTTAKIIINNLRCDNLILNASKERGIDTVRDKISSFAMTKSTNNKFKIVFLDEADALTDQAQESLKNIMETYHKNCRFILTCNNINKIVSPIRSRCQIYKFRLPDKNKILDKLNFICKNENIKSSDDVLLSIIDKNYPDIRKIIGKLERYSLESNNITKELIEKDKRFIEELFNRLENDKFSNLREWILNNTVDYNLTLGELYEYLFENIIKNEKNKFFVFIKYITETNRYIKNCAYEDIEFFTMLLKIKIALKNDK